jgi:hypothetical protein
VVVRKLSVSLSDELVSVLRALAAERSEELSPLIETLLRENWLIATLVQRRREAAMRPSA